METCRLLKGDVLEGVRVGKIVKARLHTGPWHEVDLIVATKAGAFGIFLAFCGVCMMMSALRLSLWRFALRIP